MSLTYFENDGTAIQFGGDVAADGKLHGIRDLASVPLDSLGPMTCTQQAAKEGPTISFDPILGALVAHITDRSGVTSQCEYKSDFYTSTFF